MLIHLLFTLLAGMVLQQVILVSNNMLSPSVNQDITLRVRAFFHKTIRVCHVYCNFKISFTCRITVIFGTLKDGSILINTLASNI